MREPWQEVRLGMQGQSQCSGCKLSRQVKLGQAKILGISVESIEELGLPPCKSTFRCLWSRENFKTKFLAALQCFPNVFQAPTEAMKRGH